MANIGDLKALIAAYCGETAANLTVGGVDLRLQALNNARKMAEQIHNFEENKVMARLSVSSSGGALSSAVLESDGTTAVSINTIEQCYLRDATTTPTTYYPLFFDRKKTVASRILDFRNNLAYNDEYIRYRDDNEINFGDDIIRVYQHGATLYLHPEQTTAQSLALDCVKWMTAYTADANTDFMTDHGYNYLMWAGICELNKLTKTFVFRQEGFLSPPEKERDAALAALIQWDVHRFEHVFEGIR